MSHSLVSLKGDNRLSRPQSNWDRSYAQHLARRFSRQCVGQQSQRDRQQSGADKGHDLRKEKVPVGALGENREHDHIIRFTSL
jgi:sugar (pentulose or hexulose) kinase